MAFCSHVAKSSTPRCLTPIPALRTGSSAIPNGIHEKSNGIVETGSINSFTQILRARDQEQKIEFEYFLEAQLEKQLGKFDQRLDAQKVELECIVEKQLQRQLQQIFTKTQSPGSATRHTDSSPSSQLGVGSMPLVDGVPSTASKGTKLRTKKTMSEDAELQRNVLQVCGWNSDEQTDSCGSDAKAKKNGDLAGFVPKSRCQMCLSRIVHSWSFQSFSAFLILSNSFMIAFQVHIDLRRATNGESPLHWEKFSDMGFTLAFGVELLLRIMAEQRFFFCGPARRWNYFDTVVVSSGILDFLDVLNVSFTYLRVLRVLRVIRILRVIRLFKLFRELRMMALSILSCLTSLVWAFGLLLLVLFIFAMVLLEGARRYLRDGDVNPQIRGAIIQDYHGVFASIYTLVQAVSGGRNWGEVAQPYVDISWYFGVIFVAFIIFVMFGLLNVLVGVFVQNTEAIANIDKDFVIQEEMARKSSAVNQIRDLFYEIDEDGSGTISWSEMRNKMSEDAMKAYFAMMQIEINEAHGLFRLLDVDESGEVAIEEFIMGCMRLKGTAKSIDMAALLYDNKKMHATIHRCMDGINGQLRQLQLTIANATIFTPN